MTTDIERYRALALVRVEQLADEDRTLRWWLRTVRFLGWPLFIISLVFPIAAGFEALGDFGLDVAILSFFGAAAVAVHKGLHCDTYQQALRRTIQSIRSIMENYEVIAAVADVEVVDAFQSAEARLRELRATSDGLPPMRRRRFQVLMTREISNKGA